MERTKRMLGSGEVERTKRMLGSGEVERTKRMLGSGARPTTMGWVAGIRRLLVVATAVGADSLNQASTAWPRSRRRTR
jgi:hypothetical protein